MSKGKVLVIETNARRIEIRGGGSGPTGQYLNETVVPAMAVIAAGYDVVLATPNGTKPHIDDVSLSAMHFGGDAQAFARAQDFFAQNPRSDHLIGQKLVEALEREAVASRRFRSNDVPIRQAVS